MQMIKNIQPLGPVGISLESWSETEVKSHNTNHLWIIHDYNFYKANLPKTESLKSPLFSAATDKQRKWSLEIYPTTFRNINDFSLFIKLDSTSECATAFANIKLSILNENKEIEFFRESTFTLFRTGKMHCGWKEFLRNDYELSPDKKQKLIIYCEIEFFVIENFTHAIDHSHSTNSNVAEVRPSDDPGQLFSEECSDVVISVKGKDFKACKSILSSRSPVFAAMFKYEDMKENRQNKVDINDFDEPTVEEMLNYIHTGHSENLNTMADSLLVIAEKYGLSELKEKCEVTLAKNVSAQNASDVMIIADLHQAHKLRSSVLDFIVEKYAEVMGTPAWKRMVVSHPHLVIEVCDAISNKYRN